MWPFDMFWGWSDGSTSVEAPVVVVDRSKAQFEIVVT